MRRHAHSTPLLPVLRFPNARDFQAIIADSSRPVRAHEQWRPGWENGGTYLREDTDIQDFIPAGGRSLRGALRPATREPAAMQARCEESASRISGTSSGGAFWSMFRSGISSKAKCSLTLRPAPAPPGV